MVPSKETMAAFHPAPDASAPFAFAATIEKVVIGGSIVASLSPSN